MNKNNMIAQKGLGIALFIVGIVFCAAALLGHEPACAAAACCLFAAVPAMSGSEKGKS